ncbi:hypothetical protein F4802DRAFT_357342 [Xylaria palmicola]|nr:hypothetical protein F4802DRAFT_357342 [Xylaria palmicola]
MALFHSVSLYTSASVWYGILLPLPPPSRAVRRHYLGSVVVSRHPLSRVGCSAAGILDDRSPKKNKEKKEEQPAAPGGYARSTTRSWRRHSENW